LWIALQKYKLYDSLKLATFAAPSPQSHALVKEPPPQLLHDFTHALVMKYQKRISVLLLDRIDIQIEVPRVDYEKLSEDRGGESGESICVRAGCA